MPRPGRIVRGSIHGTVRVNSRSSALDRSSTGAPRPAARNPPYSSNKRPHSTIVSSPTVAAPLRNRKLCVNAALSPRTFQHALTTNVECLQRCECPDRFSRCPLDRVALRSPASNEWSELINESGRPWGPPVAEFAVLGDGLRELGATAEHGWPRLAQFRIASIWSCRALTSSVISLWHEALFPASAPTAFRVLLANL